MQSNVTFLNKGVKIKVSQLLTLWNSVSVNFPKVNVELGGGCCGNQWFKVTSVQA